MGLKECTSPCGICTDVPPAVLSRSAGWSPTRSTRGGRQRPWLRAHRLRPRTALGLRAACPFPRTPPQRLAQLAFLM